MVWGVHGKLNMLELHFCIKLVSGSVSVGANSVHNWQRWAGRILEFSTRTKFSSFSSYCRHESGMMNNLPVEILWLQAYMFTTRNLVQLTRTAEHLCRYRTSGNTRNHHPIAFKRGCWIDGLMNEIGTIGVPSSFQQKDSSLPRTSCKVLRWLRWGPPAVLELPQIMTGTITSLPSSDGCNEGDDGGVWAGI